MILKSESRLTLGGDGVRCPDDPLRQLKDQQSFSRGVPLPRHEGEQNTKSADRAVPPPRISAKASTVCYVELFQRNLAHGLVTHDLADFQALNCELALLLFSANQFGADRIGLVAQTI